MGGLYLRASCDHVLDEVAMSRRVDDGDSVSFGFKLPERDVDGYATLTLSAFSLSITQAYLKDPFPICNHCNMSANQMPGQLYVVLSLKYYSVVQCSTVQY